MSNQPLHPPSHPPLHLGILQADSVLEPLQPAHGDYPDMFRALIRDAADALGIKVDVSIWNVEAGEYPGSIDACDAWLITGSRKSVYDDEAWIQDLGAWVKKLHERKRKLIGICFGHQMVAHFLGGQSAAAESGWCVGVQDYRVVSSAEFMLPAQGTYRLIASHKDQVKSLPPGAELLASSDTCPHAMFQLGEHMLCFQGHPEFQPAYSADLTELRRELLGPEKSEAAIKSLQNAPDRQLAGIWILNFITRNDSDTQ